MKTLTVNHDKHLALVTLNRPALRNALNDELIRELRELAEALNADTSVRAVILTGSGKAFCSGMDLAYMEKLASFDEAENRQDTENLVALFEAIRFGRLPWIAAVNGPAIAGGCGLASVCDLVLADRVSARFGYPEVKIGFLAAVVSPLLLARVGETHTRDLLLTGRIIKAESAQAMGLINELSEEGQVLALAGMRARALIQQCSPDSIAATKELLDTLPGMNLREAFRAGLDRNVSSRLSPSCRRGLKAFLNKESVDWSQEAPSR